MRASERLYEIQTRVAAALDGPWDWGDELAFPDGVSPPWVFAYGWSGYPVDDAIEHRLPATNADAEFIAHARTDVPRLVAAVQAFFDATREHRDRDRLGCECPACEGYHAACAALEL